MGATRQISFLLFLCCSFWSVLLVQSDTKTLTIAADRDCGNGRQILEDDDEVHIKYNGAIVHNCEVSIGAEHKQGKHDDEVICFQAVTFDVKCSVLVQYLEGTVGFSSYFINKTYSCNDFPTLWCSSRSSAFLRITAHEYSNSNVYIKAYVVVCNNTQCKKAVAQKSSMGHKLDLLDGDEAFIEIANKAVIAIGVVIGIVVGVIVLGVIIVIIIICCCCKRRGSRGNVYQQPHQAAAMTVVHTPISQPAPPTQPDYPTQQPGYGHQTTPGNYPIGSQPPPTSYPMYPSQQQGFMVYPPMQNQVPTAAPVPDPFTKKDLSAPPPHSDLPPPYPGS